MKYITPIAIFLAIPYAAFAQVEITDSQRYLDSSTYTLNEPCIEFNGTQFMGQFVLEAEGGYVWKILSGEELTESRTGCTQITSGSEENEILFNLSNLVIADGNADTGQRYDVDSIGDATRLDLGFSVTNAVESVPALVHASHLELPLYFTNQTYGEGLEVCLSAIGADSLSISNENNSIDLSLSENFGNGIKKFCGVIAQDDLEFGDVFYDARIDEDIIENAVTYWNPECIDGNMCGDLGDIPIVIGREIRFEVTPQLYKSQYTAYTVIYDFETGNEIERIELPWDGIWYAKNPAWNTISGIYSVRSFFSRNSANGAEESLVVGAVRIITE